MEGLVSKVVLTTMTRKELDIGPAYQILLDRGLKEGSPDECWESTNYIDRDGYSLVYYEGTVRKSHRVSYAHHYGDLEPGKIVMHTCDNPPCVNPRHLKQGTQADNMADMRAKGRSVDTRAEAHPHHTLTDAQALELIREYRRGGITMSDLGKKYGITNVQVSRLNSGRRRSWLQSQV